MPIDDIISDIESSVSRLVTQPVFIDWLGKNTVEGGDYVVINDSFVYRATSTVKSQKHLVLRADQNGILEPQPLITEGLRFNLDFKHFGKRAPKPPVSTLEEAASEEVVSLGELLFILIGEIHDTTVLEETIGHADFDTMYWDPNATDSVEIANRVITVRDVHDEAPLAEAITELYEDSGSQMPDGLLTALGIALDQLQDRAVASLVLPSQGTELGRGMTDPDPFEPSRLIAVSVALRTTIPAVLFSFVRKVEIDHEIYARTSFRLLHRRHQRSSQPLQLHCKARETIAEAPRSIRNMTSSIEHPTLVLLYTRL